MYTTLAKAIAACVAIAIPAYDAACHIATLIWPRQGVCDLTSGAPSMLWPTFPSWAIYDQTWAIAHLAIVVAAITLLTLTHNHAHAHDV